MKQFTIIIGFIICSIGLVRAADQPNKSDSSKTDSSLDAQLLESLDQSLLKEEPTAKSPAAKKATTPKGPSVAHKKSKTALDLEIEQQLRGGIEGEDIGKPGQGARHPLLPIAERMKMAEELVDGKNSDTDTQRLQKQIVDDLDRLLEGCKKCQCQGSCNKPGQCNKPGSKSGNGKGSQVAAQKPGDKLGEKKASTATTGDEESREELLKKSWGQLPQRVREQILQGAGDEFLPKYDAQIRRYFERMLLENDEK